MKFFWVIFAFLFSFALNINNSFSAARANQTDNLVAPICPIFISYPNECKLLKDLESQNRTRDPEYKVAIKRESKNFISLKRLFERKRRGFQVVNKGICDQVGTYRNIYFFEYLNYMSGVFGGEQAVKLYKVDESGSRSFVAYVVDSYIPAVFYWGERLQKKRMARKYIPRCKNL
jgi:hypothetical protein